MDRDYRKVLHEEFCKRQERNSAYSLRAFSRDLDLAPSRVSEIFNYKQGLSKQKALEIAGKLNYSRERARWFSALVELERAKSALDTARAQKNIDTQERLFERERLESQQITIELWNMLAIRRATQLKSFEATPDWIHNNLDIDKEEAKEALDEMVKRKLLVPDSEGKLVFGTNKITNDTDHNKPEQYDKAYKKTLEKAYEAKHNTDRDDRDLALHFFSINKKQLPKLKNFIRSLEDQIDSETYESGDDKDAVYCYVSALFPVSNSKKNEH